MIVKRRVSFIIFAIILITILGRISLYEGQFESAPAVGYEYSEVESSARLNKLCGANYNALNLNNFSSIFMATKHLKKKVVFADLFKNANEFEFFKSVILIDKKIVTHLANNCQLLNR